MIDAFLHEGIVFNEEQHRCWRGDEELISNTTALREAGLLVWHGGGSDVAMQNGTNVHKAIELYETGQLDEPATSPELMSYVQGWKEFRGVYRNEIPYVEQILVHPKLPAFGILDALARNSAGEYDVIEIKSGAERPEYDLQVEGYAAMVESDLGLKVGTRFLVYLSPGKFKMRIVQRSHELLRRTWEAAVIVADWKRRTA